LSLEVGLIKKWKDSAGIIGFKLSVKVLFCININETDTSTSIVVVLVFIKDRDLIVVGSEFINFKEKESVVGVDLNGLIVENNAMDVGAFEVET
jgi:hypothetical protein